MATAKKAAPKKAARKPNAAFMAPLSPGDKLAAVIGDKPAPRTEIVKKIWDYIKKNNLQDAKAPREAAAMKCRINTYKICMQHSSKS